MAIPLPQTFWESANKQSEKRQWSHLGTYVAAVCRSAAVTVATAAAVATVGHHVTVRAAEWVFPCTQLHWLSTTLHTHHYNPTPARPRRQTSRSTVPLLTLAKNSKSDHPPSRPSDPQTLASGQLFPVAGPRPPIIRIHLAPCLYLWMKGQFTLDFSRARAQTPP